MRTPVKHRDRRAGRDAADERAVRAAASAHAGLALSIGLGALINAGWLLRRPAARAACYKPSPGLAASSRCRSSLADARCSARCLGVGRARHRLARPARPRRALRIALAGGAGAGRGRARLLRRACWRGLGCATSRAAASSVPDLPAPRRGSKLLRCRSLHLHAPTALEYFASLVADDASLPLLEAAAAIAQDEYPGARHAGRAGRDRRAGRAAEAPHRRPTPRRCSGCAG